MVAIRYLKSSLATRYLYTKTDRYVSVVLSRFLLVFHFEFHFKIMPFTKSKSKRSKGPPQVIQTQPVQTFRNRRTLADHVKDNMLCAGKVSYHQRVIFVASHAIGTDPIQLKLSVEQLAKSVNRSAGQSEEITGLVVVYNTHSMYMLEGSEKCIGQFAKLLQCSVFKQNRVALVYNNANQVYMINSKA